jgi:hypothetical protein
MASVIDDKVTWMFKISFENVNRIKPFQIWLKIDHSNDVDKMIYLYIDSVVIKLFYNDSKMTISNLMWI